MLFNTHHVVLRFKESCDRPHSVGGRLCWTNENSIVKRGSGRRTVGGFTSAFQILVSYRTVDGRHRSDFVDFHNISRAAPTLKNRVVITSGSMQGLIGQALAFERDPSDRRKILGIKVRLESTKRVRAQTFPITDLCRIAGQGEAIL